MALNQIATETAFDFCLWGVPVFFFCLFSLRCLHSSASSLPFSLCCITGTRLQKRPCASGGLTRTAKKIVSIFKTWPGVVNCFQKHDTKRLLTGLFGERLHCSLLLFLLCFFFTQGASRITWHTQHGFCSCITFFFKGGRSTGIFDLSPGWTNGSWSVPEQWTR